MESESAPQEDLVIDVIGFDELDDVSPPPKFKGVSKIKCALLCGVYMCVCVWVCFVCATLFLFVQNEKIGNGRLCGCFNTLLGAAQSPTWAGFKTDSLQYLLLYCGFYSF